MPLTPLAVAVLNAATRVIIVVVTADAVVTAATHIKQAVPQVRQGWREARRQRQLLKNPRLTHNKEFDHATHS